MAVPTEIRLDRATRVLHVTFDDGTAYALPAEYLRVESPSAEVQGHQPGPEADGRRSPSCRHHRDRAGRALRGPAQCSTTCMIPASSPGTIWPNSDVSRIADGPPIWMPSPRAACRVIRNRQARDLCGIVFDVDALAATGLNQRTANPMPPRARGLSEADQALWANYAQQLSPLRGRALQKATGAGGIGARAGRCPAIAT